MLYGGPPIGYKHINLRDILTFDLSQLGAAMTPLWTARCRLWTASLLRRSRIRSGTPDCRRSRRDKGTQKLPKCAVGIEDGIAGGGPETVERLGLPVSALLHRGGQPQQSFPALREGAARHGLGDAGTETLGLTGP